MLLRGIYTSKTNLQYMIRFTGTHLINLLFITAAFIFPRSITNLK